MFSVIERILLNVYLFMHVVFWLLAGIFYGYANGLNFEALLIFTFLVATSVAYVYLKSGNRIPWALLLLGCSAYLYLVFSGTTGAYYDQRTVFILMNSFYLLYPAFLLYMNKVNGMNR